ncbi:MAG TPA: recombinase family protein, partial [Rubrobacter sp.]|nr:recombinase family protein [Rubrobacter sp.]
YEVLEEVQDPGKSGASLERPGMDRVRDLVAAGGVSVVLAQDRDRFAREPAYHYLLRREFEEHGTKIRALNDHGDESPEGELMDGILDQLAKFERAKITQRTRRGKLRRAREGKVVPTRTPDYGFRYNAARDNYLVHEEEMRIVRRVFRMVGAEGRAMNAVKKAFDREGVPTPGSARFWYQTYLRRMILDDVYRPHTFEEVAEMVAPEVSVRLDRDRCYGIWWFNRRRRVEKQVVEMEETGRRYRRRSKNAMKPPEEWIAVPVPDPGVPGGWVDGAREAIKGNHRVPSSNRRFWELSGGLLYCGCCGHTMRQDARVRKDGAWFYYRCSHRWHNGRDACPDGKSFNVKKIEPPVWRFVSDLLCDPSRLRAGLDAMMDRERKGMHGDAGQEAKVWVDRLAEADTMRRGFQEQAAKGLMTLEELEERLKEIEEIRETARAELATLEGSRQRLEELERDQQTLMDRYAGAVPIALDNLLPEERQRIYKMLRLKVLVYPDARLQVSGVPGTDQEVCLFEPLSRRPRSPSRRRRAGS